MGSKIDVTAKWDAEAAVWYVETCSVPGLVTEAATLDELMFKVECIAADLRGEEELLEHPVPVHLQAFREPLVA